MITTYTGQCWSEHVTLAKYLGVTIQYDIKWNTHINKIMSSTNRSDTQIPIKEEISILQVNSHDHKM